MRHHSAEDSESYGIFLNLIKSSLMGKIQDQSVSTYVLNSLSMLTIVTSI
jgi:hypothetical protein